MPNTLLDHAIDVRCPLCGSGAVVLTHHGSRDCPFSFCSDCDHECQVARTEKAPQEAPRPAEDLIGHKNDPGHSLPLTSTDGKISCWVDKDGRVYTDAGHNRDNCLEYESDLETRKSVRISRSQDPLLAEDWAAGDFLDQCAGTPEKLMRLARKGVLEKMSLVRLLRPDKRQAYLQACAVIERALTEACTARGEPCLEEGCAVEGEICLEACLAAGAIYREACAAAWIDLFENPENRIAAWRTTRLKVTA